MFRPEGPDPRQAQLIAEASGCTIVASVRLVDGTWAHEIRCGSHGAKVRFLANLAEYDAMVPDVRRLAEQVAGGASSRAEQATRLHAYVRDRVLFTPEVRETFSPTLRTIQQGLGDCDDSARALLALLRALGHRAGLQTLPPQGSGKAPTHVAVQADLGSGWQWLETTLDARPGEHPVSAARRLKAKRSDLG